MVAPNMATMLAFVVTDAVVPAAGLQPLLGTAVAHSFDRISVDACESTNDSVFLLAGGTVGCTDVELAAAVQAVCSDLAEQIVRDAEGATKFVRIQVAGTHDDLSAVAAGRAVAASALWKAAMFGADPNWGRVLAALGGDRDLDIQQVSIAIGAELIFDHGTPSGSIEAAGKAMAGDSVTIACVLGDGPGRAEVLTCDLTPDYVRLNAGGTT
jgi:glutamate N-acetyltransferase/amino-acid N-acetyltransferase